MIYPWDVFRGFIEFKSEKSNQGNSIIPPASTTPITWIVAVVAIQACIAGQAARMAITAGCPFVVKAVIFATSTGMRQVEGSLIPIGGIMAFIACHACKQTRMESRLRVASSAKLRSTSENAI